jgi:acetyl esterase/lipase
MPSIRLRLLNQLLRIAVKRRMSKAALTPAEIALTRSRMDRFGAAAGARKKGLVQFTEATLGGVPLCWCAPSDPANSPGQADAVRPTLLYMHGGGYFVGSSRAYRGLAANLALASNLRVGVLDYRLAPEAPYPAAPQDALAAYRALLGSGLPAAQIAIGGDSAGGNLALVTLLNIADNSLPMPAAGVLLSPWADLTGSGESLQYNAKTEAMLPSERLAEAAAFYAGEADLADWRLSPLFGDLAKLPPLLIHASAHEILRDDARRVATRSRAVGITVDYREWSHAPHVFHAFADLLPEGREAITEIGCWLAARLSAQQNLHADNSADTTANATAPQNYRQGT